MVAEKLSRNEENYFCIDCNYQHPIKHVVQRHIEANHIAPSSMCEYCNKVCPSRHALRMHLKRAHNAYPSYSK